jgi:ubiquitin-protein ligase
MDDDNNNKNKNQVVSLLDSSDVVVFGTGKASTTTTSDTSSPTAAAAAVSSFVDLTAESSSNSTSDYMKECSAKYTKEAIKAFAPPPKSKQKKRGRGSTTTTVSMGRPKIADVDAVDIDKLYQSQASGQRSADASQQDKTTHDYRQILGPLRMGFVDKFTTEHNVERYPMGASRNAAASRVGKTNLQKLYKELTEFQLNLPVEKHSAIYCRALESDLTKVRVAITGPLDSPYAAGFFIFDVELHDYPNAAPKVKFLTTGGGRVRFNPNLYQDGKCCLSLLGTWQGPGWIRNKSTLLQVLISIQGLILVNDPYFNEPGYERDRGTSRGKAASDKYNCKLYEHTLNHAIVDMILHGATTYPEFYPVIERHFAYHREFVLEKLQEWAKLSPAVQTLIPKVQATLLGLPPLVSSKHKRPPKAPETISLIDDDLEQQDDAKPAASSGGSSNSGRLLQDNKSKTPETIDLIE